MFLHRTLDYLLQYGEQKANIQVWRWSVLPGWPRKSTLLEAKRQVEYLEMPARSILKPLQARHAVSVDHQPYRGCEFGL